LLVLAYLEPAELIYFIVFAALFYYLLLIKDLLIIDRRSAYELLAIAFSFFLVRSFYAHLGENVITGASVWYGLLVSALIGFLMNSFLRNFSEGTSKHPMCRAAAWLAFILTWQFLMVGLILPLDFVYQSVIVFLVSVLVLDLIPENAIGNISRQRIVATGTTVGVLLAVVLISARWGI
jgi:hypothetical protein